MNQKSARRRRSTRQAGTAAGLLLALAAFGLVGCSSSTYGSATTSSAPSQSAPDSGAGTDQMRALCDQMVTDKMTAAEATTLAEANGYVARVGTIDGQPQPVTMDFREDRFTFVVTGGVVTACSYG